MQAKNVISLLIAVIIITGTLGISSVAAENFNVTQQDTSLNNSTVSGPNDTASPIPDNTTVSTPVPDNSTSPADNTTLTPLTMVLENHTYYPNEVVRAFIYNSTGPMVTIIDPAGISYDVTVDRLNDSAYVCEYTLNRTVILDNYTVLATDVATGITVNDTFEVMARPVIATPLPVVTITPDNNTTKLRSHDRYICTLAYLKTYICPRRR